jgi:hypothetical protein
LTALLYAGNANSGLTSGKALFGSDALGGGFGGKTDGGMFDDDEDIFASAPPTKNAAPQQK